MSSLGDLLLAHAKSKDDKVSDSKDTGHIDHDVIDDRKDTNEDVTESNLSPPPSQKVFPERIIRNDLKEKDTQSEVSSTDDYVAELLDPNDRPKNVWHMVEGPKPEDDDYNQGKTIDDSNQNLNPDDFNVQLPDNYHELQDDDSASKRLERDADRDPREKIRDDADERTVDRHRSHHDRDRSPERSSSSSRRRHRRDRDDRDRRRDRSRDRDGHRSARRSQRRHDHSDDDEEDRYRSRRYSRSRRSRSRSPRDSSRRRNRSRSRSLTKRNSRTILIMQLNPKVTSRDLEDFFSVIGRVKEVRLIIDSKTRRHKGIAYIEFEDTSSASKAFALNGEEFFGAPIVIQSASMDKGRGSGDWPPSSSHSASHTSHSSSRPPLPLNSYRVYVGALHVGINEDMLRSVFEPFGPLIRLELMRDRVTNISRGYAFITYTNIEDGQNAVQALDGLELGGKAIRVSKSTDKTNDRSAGGDSSRISSNIQFDSPSEGRTSRSRDVTASLFELAGH